MHKALLAFLCLAPLYAQAGVVQENEIITQGAMVVSMSYKRASDGKTFDFIQDLDVPSSLEAGCKWGHKADE